DGGARRWCKHRRAPLPCGWINAGYFSLRRGKKLPRDLAICTGFGARLAEGKSVAGADLLSHRIDASGVCPCRLADLHYLPHIARRCPGRSWTWLTFEHVIWRERREVSRRRCPILIVRCQWCIYVQLRCFFWSAQPPRAAIGRRILLQWVSARFS